MISPIEAKEIFVKKFNIDDYCRQLDESIKDYLTSDCAFSGEYAVGYLSGTIPEFVMEKIATMYMYAGWKYVYFITPSDIRRGKVQFKLSMKELDPMEAEDYKVVVREDNKK